MSEIAITQALLAQMAEEDDELEDYDPESLLDDLDDLDEDEDT